MYDKIHKKLEDTIQNLNKIEILYDNLHDLKVEIYSLEKKLKTFILEH